MGTRRKKSGAGAVTGEEAVTVDTNNLRELQDTRSRIVEELRNYEDRMFRTYGEEQYWPPRVKDTRDRLDADLRRYDLYIRRAQADTVPQASTPRVLPTQLSKDLATQFSENEDLVLRFVTTALNRSIIVNARNPNLVSSADQIRRYIAANMRIRELQPLAQNVDRLTRQINRLERQIIESGTTSTIDRPQLVTQLDRARAELSRALTDYDLLQRAPVESLMADARRRFDIVNEMVQNNTLRTRADIVRELTSESETRYESGTRPPAQAAPRRSRTPRSRLL